MGSRTYDFLSESLLFDESLISDQFRTVPDDELRKELQRYREFCLAHVDELERELHRDSSALKLFSANEKLHLNFLLQSAFYVQQYVLPDPLFALTYEKGSIHKSYDKLFGMPDKGIDKREITGIARYLKTLTPMVVADYVKLLPVTYLFESSDNLPMFHSENGFADVLPEPLLQFFRAHATVWSLKKEDSGWSMNGSFEVSRGIHIHFGEPDEMDETGSGYFLSKEKILSVDQEKRTMKSFQWLPSDPPDQETFDKWVFQSVNQSAGRLYRKLLDENLLAAQFGASYTTQSQFVYDLLEQALPADSNIQTHTANTFLNLELPFLDKVDMTTLMKIRVEDGEAFQNFRLEVEKQFRDLRSITDPNQLRYKTESVLHELSVYQLNQVRQKIDQVKRRSVTDVAIGLGGLIGSFQSKGFGIAAMAVALWQGYKTLDEYRNQRSQNPAYFLWKVLKDSRMN
jgi:hypothetical protein